MSDMTAAASKAQGRKIVVNRRSKTIIFAALIFMVILGVYLSGAFLSDDLIRADFSKKALKPSLAHPFGTDLLGRDMLVRTIKGLSVSISVGMTASCVSAVIALFVAWQRQRGAPGWIILSTGLLTWSWGSHIQSC